MFSIWPSAGTPQYSPAYYAWGSARANRGHYQEAKGDLDEAIRLDPEYAHRARIYTQLRNYRQARQDLERAVELGSDRAPLEEAIEEMKRKR